MSTSPPRRPRRPSSERTSLPIVPILIGVIVLGFVIGAGLSLAGRHDDGSGAAVAPAAPTPQATLARVTPAPSERPAPARTDAPTERTSDAPTAEPRDTVAPHPAATVAIAPHARVRSVPAAAARPAATPRDDASDARVPVESSTSTATVAPAATASAIATAVASTLPVEPTVTSASSVADGDAAFAKLAAAVVREYVAAVARGDQESAYAALGASPGDRGASLTEAAVLDARTRIEHVESHGAANGTALVSVALATSSGPYEGQFTVKRSDSGAAIIVQHGIVKP